MADTTHVPRSPFDLSGQKVLIIGGGSRMGLAIAQLAAAQGADVIISGRSADKLAQAIAGNATRISSQVVDASDPVALRELLQRLMPIDHLVVTVSSGSVPASSIPDTPTAVAQAAFSRFWISYNVLHHAPAYLARRGSITLLSGSSGKTPAKGLGVWGTLHGSINALIRQAAIELAPLRINGVSPGGIGIRSDRQLAEHAGQPVDVAQMILAILINPALTNTIIDVDGGERLGTWSGER